jgi:bifunctional DNA-binding transcriptional regulator/antitoxin component of YhaV-PrlF toxin-antitoxin module
MAKVTSKLQLTLPKVIADQYGIRPGDELQWVAAGESIRVFPHRKKSKQAEPGPSLEARLELFDKATQRQRQREASVKRNDSGRSESSDRGWKREDLYRRDRPD